MFYLPTQAAAGAHASFFMVFDGGRRKAINPYQWIDKTIINHKPEPEITPVMPKHQLDAFLIRKDPKLTRALLAIEAEKHAHQGEDLEQRIDAAIQVWRQHSTGTGDEAFFKLAVGLARAGMSPSVIERTLYQEAVHAHGRSFAATSQGVHTAYHASAEDGRMTELRMISINMGIKVG